MTDPLPKVKIRAALGKNIPGDGKIYISQSTASPEIGECIYCGSRDQLSDEHTIPYALFGVATLRSASCFRCSQATQKVEQRLLRGTFGQVREFLKFPTRKAKKNGTWTGMRRGTDSRTGKTVEVPISDGVVGLWTCFPDYTPRLMSGSEFTEKHKTRSLSVLWLNSIRELPPAFYEDQWIKFNSSDLERCAAKIALCEAIRVVDQRIRDPLLSDFIINGSGDSTEFIGGGLESKISDNMHSIDFQQLRGAADEVAWLARVKLFSFLPTPQFQVVVRPQIG